jgi:hypothetical protein
MGKEVFTAQTITRSVNDPDVTDVLEDIHGKLCEVTASQIKDLQARHAL